MEKTIPTFNTYKVVTLLFLSLFSFFASAQKAGLYTFSIDCPGSSGEIGYGVLEIIELYSETRLLLINSNCNRTCSPAITINQPEIEMINDSTGKYVLYGEGRRKQNTLMFKFGKDEVVIVDNDSGDNNFCSFSGVYKRTLNEKKLKGVWENTKRPGTYEEWGYEIDENGKTIFDFKGRGYKVVNGKEVLTEELRFINEGDEWYYEATVNHNSGPVKFKLTSFQENKWVFENPEHDFPQKIVYEWLSATELKVYVSAGEKGFVVNFKKVE